MDLKHIAEEIRSYEGVQRKRAIGAVVKCLQGNNAGRFEHRILASFGEDAGVLDLGTDKVMLIANDGIWGRLIKVDAWWAGYCAVLVNVNDIAAMGGRAIGMVDMLSIKDVDFCREVAKGMKDGVKKFRVPLLGGHVHPNMPYNAVDIAIIGEAKKGEVIYSHTAKKGDHIIIAVDLEGRLYPKFPLNWDSTTMKSPRTLEKQLDVMVRLGEERLLTSGKDISNPGMLGTLGMLFETSKIGGTVNLTKIPIPEGVELTHWLKVYPGFGFTVTAKKDNVEDCIEIFREQGVEARDVGIADPSLKLKISNGDAKEVVFDLNKSLITNISL